MAGAKKTLKTKKQEIKANFIRWRFALLCGGILLALVGLLSRVAWLQVVKPERLVKEGDMRSLRVQSVPSSRGMISDRNGRPLAVSVPVSAIWADPKEVNAKGGIGYDNRWKALADALSLSLDQLSSRINANPKGRFVYLARQVNPAVSSYIQKLKLPGINLREESRRLLPCRASRRPFNRIY
jgi:peptidoglycan synthetase FtsI (EC 2.4.1.129)